MKATTGFIGALTKNYERRLGPVIFRPWAELIAERVGAGEGRALDLACGTGFVSEALRGYSTIGLDLSLDMLAFADGRAESLIFGTASGLPFGSDSFELAVCQFGWMFFSDPNQVGMELRRVVRPGGTVWISVWNTLTANPVPTVVRDVITEFFPDDPATYFDVPFRFKDGNEIVDCLHLCGFREGKSERIDHVVTFPSAEYLAKSFVEGNRDITKLLARDEVDSARVISAIAAKFGSGPIRATTSGHIVRAH